MVANSRSRISAQSPEKKYKRNKTRTNRTNKEKTTGLLDVIVLTPIHLNVSLPALAKICERVALNQFTEYAIRRNCLSGHQSGNKKRHSTETLNILMSDLALEAMDRKQVTALVLLDLSKAFDSIDHMSLL